MPKYRIVGWADLYNGNWCVVRLDDMRIVKTMPFIWDALRWVKIWGPTLPNISGQELSWRAKERLSDPKRRIT